MTQKDYSWLLLLPPEELLGALAVYMYAVMRGSEGFTEDDVESALVGKQPHELAQFCIDAVQKIVIKNQLNNRRN